MKNQQKIKIEVVQNSNTDWYFEQRETQKHHSSYEWEQVFFACIRDGNVKRLDQLLKDTEKSELLVGRLSSNDLRQAQYLAVAFITLSTRSAIQGGMLEMDAYNKSDAFIQKIDRLFSPEEVTDMIFSTMRDMTVEMHDLHLTQSKNPAIRLCLEYIYQNLHSRITLRVLAKKCSLSAPYLSALFNKEMGTNLSTYIMRQKIKAAQAMMIHSTMTIQEISNYLEFSSQSYFINCFKRECGMTPGAYIYQGGRN